jgi:hypothetical protein
MRQEYKVVRITRDEIVPTAEKMKKEGRILLMIHGYMSVENEPVVAYEYEEDHAIVSCQVVGETNLPSISGVYDAAAGWPEWEINELMGFTFEGLDTSQRLFLPEELSNGRGQILVTPLKELREEAFEQYAVKSGLVNTLERDDNHNGIPDILEKDENGNSIPDVLEKDGNRNGTPDIFEKNTADKEGRK